MLEAGIDPGTRAFADEREHVGNCRLRDALVDCRLNELRGGSKQARTIGELPDRQDVLWVDRHVREGHRAACRCTLTERTPVVDDRQSSCIARYPDLHGAAFVVGCARGNAMGEERAGGIETLAVEAQTVRRPGEPCRALQNRIDACGAAFRAGIAKPLARQHLTKQTHFLRRRADLTQYAQYAEMVLRNLAQRRIGRAQDHKDFRQRGIRHVGAAVFARHRDRAEATCRPEIQFGPWKQTFAVAFGSVDCEPGGKCVRGSDRFCIAGDAAHTGWVGTPRQRCLGRGRFESGHDVSYRQR